MCAGANGGVHLTPGFRVLLIQVASTQLWKDGELDVHFFGDGEWGTLAKASAQTPANHPPDGERWQGLTLGIWDSRAASLSCNPSLFLNKGSAVVWEPIPMGHVCGHLGVTFSLYIFLQKCLFLWRKYNTPLPSSKPLHIDELHRSDAEAQDIPRVSRPGKPVWIFCS